MGDIKSEISDGSDAKNHSLAFRESLFHAMQSHPDHLQGISKRTKQCWLLIWLTLDILLLNLFNNHWTKLHYESHDTDEEIDSERLTCSEQRAEELGLKNLYQSFPARVLCSCVGRESPGTAGARGPVKSGHRSLVQDSTSPPVNPNVLRRDDLPSACTVTWTCLGSTASPLVG